MWHHVHQRKALKIGSEVRCENKYKEDFCQEVRERGSDVMVLCGFCNGIASMNR